MNSCLLGGNKFLIVLILILLTNIYRISWDHLSGRFRDKKAYRSCSELVCRNDASGDKSVAAELHDVQQEFLQKNMKLSRASDIQVGMEIMHLFIIDLLGRGTAPAKIFESKTSEE